MLGDPEQIRLISRRLAVDAEHLRRLALQVAATGDVAWRSPAADLFRVQVVARAGGLRCRADELEAAARLLAVHAEAVEGARAAVIRVAALGASLPEAVGGALRGGGRR
ncbi:hypothetical protein [Phycicoccus sp. Soil802]|uniref:hypothetical protein n=1 Tax=Phycicoccus sp. Soil802 TaxID=1736414 RepID=UPI000702BB7F|nr:hypothetical protein [Phycicoccus sp. Soil802]KRF21879.1 hypothetical protein ASG91_19510 [Phycicoccus sp. Soil802]